ncbi:MAG: DAK2 domain-containing protein [Acidimicrobiia bacterium]|nr:DAK2 domain-containing protein [Acidimicrobiia bacterium]
MSEVFTASDLRALLRSYAGLLAAHEDEINALNVYPVADGDTGTNMLSTVQGVVDAIGDATGPETLAETGSRAARAALRAARGSSGIIFCQWLRSLLAELPEEGAHTAALSRALARAADAAYAAVEEPVEGTMLTVARAAADATATAYDVAALWQVAAVAADAALVRTPDLLPVLRQAGVVDSGARALALLFDAAGGTAPEAVHLVTADPAVATEIHMPGGPHRHEVTFLLEATSTSPLLEAWRDIGDAIVVAGDGSDGGWRCHIHTDDVEAAIAAGRRTGPVDNVHVEELPGPFGGTGRWRGGQGSRTGAVAVTVGTGLATRLRELGAVVVQCAKTMNASIGEVTEAINAAPGTSVVVLPGDPDTLAACEAACELAEKEARIVPATSLASALACMERLDAARDLDANLTVMQDALALPWFEVAEVARDAPTRIGDVSAGDWVVIDADGIVRTAADPIEAARHGMDRLGNATTVEVYAGLQADPDRTDSLLAFLRDDRPDSHVVLREGDQPWQAWLVRVPADSHTE